MFTRRSEGAPIGEVDPIKRDVSLQVQLLAVAGILWPGLAKLPWGRLPGDISIERQGFSFHFPLITSLIVSLVLSMLVWWFWRK